jgi:hypothetical protein
MSCGMFAQATKEISMAGIIEDADSYIDLIENEYDNEIVRMEFDIISDTKETFRDLMEGYDYGIVAFGDWRIKDIDINVYKYTDDDWELIESDEDVAEYAFVTVTPDETASYMIEIKAYEFNEGYDIGHYGLLIFHP